MLHDSIFDETRKLAILDEIGEHQRIFGADGAGIEDEAIDFDALAADGEARGIQVADAAVSLAQMMLEGDQPEFLNFSDERGAITGQSKLETINRRRGSDGRGQRGETFFFEAAISVCEQEH